MSRTSAGGRATYAAASAQPRSMAEEAMKDALRYKCTSNLRITPHNPGESESR